MSEKIFYVEINKRKQNKLYKWYKKIFYKYEIRSISDNRFYLVINQDSFNHKMYSRVMNDIKSNNVKFVFSKEILVKENIDNKYMFSGKILMKQLIFKILDYIEQFANIDLEQESIFITANNDKNIYYIQKLGKIFKNVNIITDRAKKISRMQKRLEEDESIVVSVQNNKKKSLKRAKFIINFDYDGTFFENYCFNRNCIIINLYAGKLQMKNTFQGVVIEDIDISCNKIDGFTIEQDNYKKNILYESYTFNLSDNLIEDNIYIREIKVDRLIGKKSDINILDIKNNYIKSSRKLDKLEKKG